MLWAPFLSQPHSDILQFRSEANLYIKLKKQFLCIQSAYSDANNCENDIMGSGKIF